MIDTLVNNIKNKTFASLAVRNYRLYFFGQAISVSGTWMQTVALGWLALTLSGSGSQLGIVVALQFLPMLIFGPWGGMVADHFNKRTVIVYTQTAFGVQALVLGLLVLTGATQIWMLYILALIYGFIRLVDEPARQSFVSEMVGSEYLKNAVSLNAMTNNLARAIGPSFGGILIATVGIGFCFIVNSLLRVAVIAMLFSMRKEELHHQDAKKKVTGLKEGFQYVMATPVIRDTLLMMAIVGTFAYEWQVSLPMLAQQTFNGNAASYGILMSSFGFGAVLGGLTAASRHTIVPRHVIIFLFLFGISLIATGLAPTFQLAIIGTMVIGFFSINLSSLANTMIQLESVPEMRGRVMALWMMAMMGSTTIGGPLIGIAGEYLGARWGLLIGGISALIAGSFASWPLLRDRVLAIQGNEESNEAASI